MTEKAITITQNHDKILVLLTQKCFISYDIRKNETTADKMILKFMESSL